MNMPLQEAVLFAKTHLAELRKLTALPKTELVICPSLATLYPVASILHNSGVFIGAQNCSQYSLGAYTGEESARTLAENNCSYCIVGHSERRLLFGETDHIVAQKVARLLEASIKPIICVGADRHAYETDRTIEVIEQQLLPIITPLSEMHAEIIYIAYEPIWAIGTNIVPDNDHIEQVLVTIKRFIHQKLRHLKIRVLYGGSVNDDSIGRLKQLSIIDGFLIGGASTNFQKLQKIVS